MLVRTKSAIPNPQSKLSMLNFTELCILRVHLEKRVLHLRAVDAGTAAPETHKNTPIGQKFCNTT